MQSQDRLARTKCIRARADIPSDAEIMRMRTASQRGAARLFQNFLYSVELQKILRIALTASARNQERSICCRKSPV
jgi:hypothetical protein